MSRLLLTAVLLLTISPCYSQLAVYVRDSIAAGQYGDAEDAIQKRLAAEPNDADARYMLVLLYLKARQPLAARPAFDSLRALANGNPHAKELADQVEPFLPPPPIPTDQVGALTAELNRYRAAAAAKAVDRMTIGAQQKEIIRLYLDLYQARFVSGLTRLQKLARAGGLGAEEAQGLRQEINSMTGDYTTLNTRLNEFLLSPLANGACTPESARSAVQAQNLLLEEYARVASNAVSAFPLNARFLDLGFHAMLLVAGYDELEKFGDLVLLAKGEIRVPFFSRDSLFSLVIDEAGQRLYTEATKGVAGNPAGSDGMETMTAFDLPFARITAIRQRAQSDLTTQGLAAKSYCLRLEPEGLAPHYAFMPLLHCLYGEEAQKRSTANLGRFILHVARDTQIRATLVDPGKQTKDVFNGVMNKLAIGSMAGAVMSLGSGGLGNLQMAGDSVRQGVGILKGTAEERNRMRTIQAGQAQAREGWQNDLADRIVTTLMLHEMTSRFPHLDAYLDELGNTDMRSPLLLAILCAAPSAAQLVDSYSDSAAGYRDAAAQACTAPAKTCYLRQADYYDCLAKQTRTGDGVCTVPPACKSNGCSSGGKLKALGRAVVDASAVGAATDSVKMVRELMKLHGEEPKPVDDGFHDAQKSALEREVTGDQRTGGNTALARNLSYTPMAGLDNLIGKLGDAAAARPELLELYNPLRAPGGEKNSWDNGNPPGCEIPGTATPPILTIFRGAGAVTSIQYGACLPKDARLSGKCADNPPLRVIHAGPTGQERIVTTETCGQMDPERPPVAWFGDAEPWDGKPSRPGQIETLLHAGDGARVTYDRIAASFASLKRPAGNWLEEQTARWKQLRNYFADPMKDIWNVDAGRDGVARYDERIVLAAAGTCTARPADAGILYRRNSGALHYELHADRMVVTGGGKSRAFLYPFQADAAEILAATDQSIAYFISSSERSLFLTQNAEIAQSYFSTDEPIVDAVMDGYGSTIFAIPYVVAAIGRDARLRPVAQLENEAIRSLELYEPDNSVLIATVAGLWKLLPSGKLYPLLSGEGSIERSGAEYRWCAAGTSYQIRNLTLPGEEASDRQYSGYLVAKGIELLQGAKPRESLRFLFRARAILEENADVRGLIDRAIVEAK